MKSYLNSYMETYMKIKFEYILTFKRSVQHGIAAKTS